MSCLRDSGTIRLEHLTAAATPGGADLALDPTGALCDVIQGLLPRAGTFGDREVTDPTFRALMEVAR